MFKLSITHAYLLALALIASSMISAYAITTYKVKTSIDNSSIINTSGMQRMLSQRLGLLSSEIITAENEDLRIELVEKFESALVKFSNNHHSLYTLSKLDTTSQTIKDMYSRRSGVDVRSRQFITLAHAILEEVRTVDYASTHQRKLTSQLVTIARNGFLAELDAVVQEYNNLASQAVIDFQQLELVILCIGLLLLLAEAVFIFRPIVKTSLTRQKNLEKSNHELMEFSFRISHDLRSPVASCRGLVEIAREAVEDNDQELVTDMIQRMDKSMLRLETLIEDIIAVTRNSITDAEFEYVNVRAVITETMEELSALSEFDKCVFEVENGIEAEIYTKRLYLKQIIHNLLANAIKYANIDSSHVAPRVSISIQKTGTVCELIVEDNGIGIPESCRDKMFGMFMRFHPNHATGSGLGLYLSYQNAQALGGLPSL